MTIDDFRRSPPPPLRSPFVVIHRGLDVGDRAARLAKNRARVLVITYAFGPEIVVGPLDKHVPYDTVVVARAIGMISVAAGPDVYIEDILGLADPLAARTDVVFGSWPGHEKVLPIPWVIARFARDAQVPDNVASRRDIEAARKALRCPAIRELWERVSGPLSISRVLANATEAFTDYRMRINRDPVKAAASCG